MEIEKISIAELLTFKYLTESLRPFSTHSKRFWKNFKAKELNALAYEIMTRFVLLFIRDHVCVWMRFKDVPLDQLFSKEEWKSICDRFGNDTYTISIMVLDRWLSKRFRASTTKGEMNLLVSDFDKTLSGARELIITCRLFGEAIGDALKSGAITKDSINEFLNSNKDDKAPGAYDRSIEFLSKLPNDVQKSIGDALVIERNYLSDHGLFPHLHRIEEGVLEKYFLKILRTHAAKLAEAFAEKVDEQLGPMYDLYYKILPKFKRRLGAHFEHYLNKTLFGERKHTLSDREKLILSDDLTCPFCGFNLTQIFKENTTANVICPVCKVAIGRWGFENDRIPESELPDSLFRNPNEGEPTYRVKTFTPAFDWNFSELLDQRLVFDVSLTEKEREVIDAVREADDQGVSISEILRQIARERGNSVETIRMHYKSALKKLKKLPQNHQLF